MSKASKMDSAAFRVPLGWAYRKQAFNADIKSLLGKYIVYGKIRKVKKTLKGESRLVFASQGCQQKSRFRQQNRDFVSKIAISSAKSLFCHFFNSLSCSWHSEQSKMVWHLIFGLVVDFIYIFLTAISKSQFFEEKKGRFFLLGKIQTKMAKKNKQNVIRDFKSGLKWL